MDRRTALCALAAGAAAPGFARAQTPPLAIDEGYFVDLNGMPQWVTIRGTDLRNPVMLGLHGGPGAAASHMAGLVEDSLKYVTRVSWDQPGGGATALRTPDQGELTTARLVRDGLALAEHLKRELRVRKMILAGASAGTRLGVEMIHRRPDLFSAFVGNGMNVGSRGARMRYDLSLSKAKERGDTVAVEALERVGPPPFRTVEDYFVCQQYANPPGLPASPIEKAATEDLSRRNRPPPPGAKYIAYPDRYGMDIPRFLATQAAMFDEAQRWEIRSLGRDFKVPIFVFQGENDINCPTVLAREWVEEIRAPKKVFEIIPGSGHDPTPFGFHHLTLLRLHVLPLVKS